MHPAYSVILFTTASGAGYGLIFWLTLSYMVGGVAGDSWFAFIALTVGLVLVTVGLLSSMLHLGHPERAQRALSQWRSSWLSREGVVAVATYVPAGLLWLAWASGETREFLLMLAFLTAAGSVATVYCTGMIYASLRTIRQWYRGDVPLIYLGLAGATGLVLMLFLQALFQSGISTILGLLALISLAGAGAAKWLYWRGIEEDKGKYTVDQALGFHGKTVRPLDPPHTSPNFVMREMGYSVARKHADKLRQWVLLALFAAPALLVFIAVFAGGWAAFFLALATASIAFGVVTERWLFFAEAEHVSMLYYGAKQA